MDQIFVVQPEKTEASRDGGMRTSLNGLLWVTKGTIFDDEKMCTLSVFTYYELRKIWMLLWNQTPNFVITFYIFYLLSSGVHTQTHMLSKVLEFWLLLIIYLLNFKNFHLSILMELNSLLICCLWHYKA